MFVYKIIYISAVFIFHISPKVYYNFGFNSIFYKKQDVFITYLLKQVQISLTSVFGT